MDYININIYLYMINLLNLIYPSNTGFALGGIAGGVLTSNH
jgi:hypothetical protein